MFPFIFLITTQLFFIKLFENNQIEIFKYSGFKKYKINIILSIISLVTGIIIITLFYNFSSTVKNVYLKLKSDIHRWKIPCCSYQKWTLDKRSNWGKNTYYKFINNRRGYLINNFISEFDENYTVLRNIESPKIDISKKEWEIFNAKIYIKNNYEIFDKKKITTNFDLDRIKTLYSNLSSLNIFQLYELRENYKKLNLSLTEVELQLYKLATLPLYLFLVSIFTSLIMFRAKRLENTTFKISLGLFFSVIIYYINNFFYVLGNSEKIPMSFSIFIPLLLFVLVNFAMSNNVNEK